MVRGDGPLGTGDDLLRARRASSRIRASVDGDGSFSKEHEDPLDAATSAYIAKVLKRDAETLQVELRCSHSRTHEVLRSPSTFPCWRSCAAPSRA